MADRSLRAILGSIYGTNRCLNVKLKNKGAMVVENGENEGDDMACENEFAPMYTIEQCHLVCQRVYAVHIFIYSASAGCYKGCLHVQHRRCWR